MTGEKNLSGLSALVAKEWIPASLSSGAAEIDTLLARLRYRNLLIERSPDNVTTYYGLTLNTRELAFDLFGSGLKVIFFPSTDPNAPESEFGVAFEYRWAILRYVPEFETLSFAGTGKAFFDIFLELVDITEVQFLTGIVDCFIDDPAPYQALVDKLKQWQGGSSPLAALTLASQPVGYTEIEYVIQQMTAANVDVFASAFEAVIEDLSDIDGSVDRLVALFQRWLGDISREDIESLLLPQFSVALKQVAMAIEVPRTVLIPLDANTNAPVDDATKHSRLTFTAGGVRYDSASGFAVDIDQNVAVTFDKSVVPRFGLTLEFDDIKIDLSRTTNIAEATADGRPVDFMGVFIGNAVVGLPEKWFANVQPASGNAVTLGIVGRNLLFGTGGMSGTIGLEVLAAGRPKPAKDKHTGPDELEFVLGQQPAPGSSDPRKGFKLGFSSFDMTFQQNTLLDSAIKGSITVPRFDPNPIDIDLFISGDGDFELTASVAAGHAFTFPDVFVFTATSLAVGKDDKRVYLRTSGDLSFSNNSILSGLITKPIHLDKLLIHSDGGIEVEGGTVPLPESAGLKIGPVKITITAIHIGAHEQEHAGVLRKYRYFGFDGGVSVNPGGVDARGDGIKFYYTVDDDANAGRAAHRFLRIDGIGIDLVIPGNASRENAALLLQGYLSLKDPVYQGSIAFQLPSAKIAGGAAMSYDTSYPAWIVDANLELPMALPLGSTGLGIFGFRGLFGLRYVAAREAIQPPTPGAPLPDDASWGDYYRAKQDVKGVTYKKFITPQSTGGSTNPFSVGAGVSLATQADNGKAFSSQLFLLVSLPNLILLEGRADVLADHRVGLTDDDPPYYAYLALSSESIELGAGVSYLIPKSTGTVLNLNAVLEAAFFFHNSSAWYVHFGTKEKPVTARIISMFDGYAYLMLSASGIETGTGVHFDFNKSYGPVCIAAHAYLDLWAHISFERFQAGGGIALGGYVDVRVFRFGLYIELAASLTVEVPEPFRVAGSVEVCVTVKLIKTFHKCCTLDFVWDRNQTVNLTPVKVITLPADAPAAAVAVHMVSGATYPVEFSDAAAPQQALLVPLDAYIDVKFAKPVNPSAVSGLIGGYTSPPVGEIELMPPQYGSRIVRHAYALDDVKLEVLVGTAWLPYHPYGALAPGALLDAQVQTQLAGMPLGIWQKQDPGYSQIRFLALTPFSWMGAVSGNVPEEMGVTAKSTYCVARARDMKCLQWTAPAYYSSNTDYSLAGVLYRVEGDRVEAVGVSQPGLSPVSLAIAPAGRASFRILESAVHCRLMLFTTAPSVTVHWQRRKLPSATAGTGTSVAAPWTPLEFEDVGAPLVVPRASLANPVVYDDPNQPIEQIVLETPAPDTQAIAGLEEQIALRNEDWVRADEKQRLAIGAAIAGLVAKLQAEHDNTCVVAHDSSAGDQGRAIAELQSEVAGTVAQIDSKQKTYNASCVTSAASRAAALDTVRAPQSAGSARVPAMSAADCRKLAADIAALRAHLRDLENRIAALLKEAAAAATFPPGWECGTFVHQICWLSEADYAFNQSIPNIAAIEADFSTMRAAAEGTIAPIWQPRQTYRITLAVSDTVTDHNGTTAPPNQQNYYVHFRTDGPLGHFTGVRTSSLLATAPGNDDGRLEVPERAVKFYVDMDKSLPDPSGNLLYAKPIYYHDVQLQLFFNKPYAYHFFADWPDVGAGARTYALELAVKDPAEAVAVPTTAPPAPDYESAFVSAPLLGAQSWVVDPNPTIAEEFKAIRNFQNPLADGSQYSTACLTIGGNPITPLSKALQVDMGDLEPDKLYTAVVLNRSVDENSVAEVGSYPFKTSRYPDFAGHIASCRLTDGAQNQRLAVFSLDHSLASAVDEPAVLAAALAIVDRTPTTDTLAYADFFDRLLYGQLKLAPPPSAASLEFNFMTNVTTGRTYGLWVRSPEALFDPRLPDSLVSGALRLLDAGVVRTDAHVLFSRDCCQAFVMVDAGNNFPIQNVSFEFTNHSWDGNAYTPQTVASDLFDKP